MPTNQGALAVQDAAAITQATSPMGLLQLAIEREGSIDVIERLANLQMQMMDREARIAYIQAFEEFKRTAPAIVKDSAIVVNGQERGKFAKLDQICDKLIPALLAVGITHRWKTSQDGGNIVCTCYLRHRLGHEEQGATFAAPPDTSGSKNAVQAVGSTGSYLERYTLVASCGIAIKGMDSVDTGQKHDGMAPDVLQGWLKKMRAATDPGQLAAIYREAYVIADKMRDKAAMFDLIKCHREEKARYKE
jgi:hypothetical protein